MVCHARPSFAAAALALLLAPWPLCAQQEPQRIEVLGHYETQVGTSDAASEGSVTARLIANRPALRPAEVLEFVPGVIVTQHSGDGKANQYFLRGFSLDHGTDFATWVDGMPINQPTHAHGHGYTDLNFLIPELVRRIDYRKGPYFAEEGDFSSVGSARIRLADVLPRGIAQLTFGEHAYRRVLLADSRTAGAGHLLGALELLLNDGPWRQPEDLRKWNGWLRWSQHGPARQRSLTLMAYDARWTATDQIPERAVAAGLVDRFGTLDPNDGGRSRRVSLSGRQHLQLHDGDLEVSAYAIASRLTLFSNFTYFLDDETRGDQFEQSESRRTVGGTASRRWQRPFFGRQADFTLGGQWRHDRLSPVGLHHTQARRRVDTAQESRVRQTQAGLYGELGLSWTPWLRSVAGLRADAARFDTRSSIAENSGRTSAHLVSP
ncbi:MAG: TonB-dependent receptor plug domain-containing protein, partial [Pseudomonadota bacterium]